jgi:DNA-binding CsgD family transcriptional regulator/PAS domain-containing protein
MSENMLDRLDEIISILTDKAELNRAIALYQRGMTSGDRTIYSDDDYRAENMIAAVEVIKHYKGDVDYFHLLQNHSVMKPLLDMAEKHINDGTRLDLLLGVLKTYNLCYEHMLRVSSVPLKDILDFMMNYRKVHDAFELVAMRKWFILATEKFHEEINTLNDRIDFANAQFKAVVETFGHPAVITDNDGEIRMMNREAYKYFALVGRLQRQLCDLLDYHYVNFCDFVKSYGKETEKYVRFMNGEQFLTKLIRLSPTAYMFTLIPVHDKEMVKNLKEKLAGLTPTETVICSYIIRGLSTKDISDELFISIDTVNTHRKNIRRKLGLSGSSESIADKLGEVKDIKF